MDVRFDRIGLDEQFPFDITLMNLGTGDSMNGYMHWHDCFEISCITGGEGAYYVEDRVYPVQKTDTVVINNIEPHRLLVGEKGLQQLVLIFDPSLIWSSGSNLVDYEYIIPFVERGTDFCNLLPRGSELSKTVAGIVGSIHEEYRLRGDGWRLMIKANLLLLLTLLFRHFRSGEKSSKTRANLLRLQEVFRMIDENPAQKITLERAARAAHFTPPYFSQFFKSTTGVSFKEYVTNHRIRHAVELLNATSLKIIDIASASGFHNLGNFNKVFKQHTGKTPSQFR